LLAFGEKGWFGVISNEIGFETMSIVAQAVADYLNDTSPSGPVVLGYDTRFLSREYAWIIQRVLTGNQIQVLLHKKPVPAAFISLSVKIYQARLGIMVTGEDRPARYSGLSFWLPEGSIITPGWMDALYQYLYRRYPRSSEDSRHLLQYIDVFPEYKNHLENFLDLDTIRRHDPYIASDSFFGSVGTYMQDLMKRWKIRGISIRTKPNPCFMDMVPQPNERNMNPVSKLVSQKNADLGLFFSGDGSSIGAVSPMGWIIPGVWISAVILDEWLKYNKLEVYTEIFTPNAAFSVLSHHGLKALPLNLLTEKNSGINQAVIWDRYGLVIGPFLPQRDGILQSLLLLQILCREEMDWAALARRIKTLSGDRMQEHKSIQLDAEIWDKKEKELIAKGEDIVSEKIIQWLEEGNNRKLCFQDGSWLGFHYNPEENCLFVYWDFDLKKGQKVENIMSSIITWLTE